MKRILFILLVLALAGSTVSAHTVVIEVSGIRGDQGSILVMVQGGKDSEPVYGKAKSENGKATIRLEDVSWDKFNLSVFHDENGNMQLDMTERKGPAEGYAMKNCEAETDEVSYKLKLYYPINQ